MGGGSYSYSARAVRADSMGYTTLSAGSIFKSKQINNAMEPCGVDIRESRDSVEHPNSVPVIIALDVTGSMGSIPHYLVKQGLPDIMKQILDAGIADPQILFLAIGDHQCDNSPLQVGQFESSDELLDKWLTTVYLEGGGGGNEGESYLLAWYFAGKHTVTDSWEKRKQKGILITIGDEPTLREISGRSLKNIMGDGEYSNCTSAELLEKARETYNVFHIHITSTRAGKMQTTVDGWKQLMGSDLVVVDSREEVPGIIASKVVECAGVASVATPLTETPTENML